MIRCLRIARKGLGIDFPGVMLTQTLKSLVRRGLLRDFKLENGSLLVWGDFRSLGAILEAARLTDQENQPSETDMGRPLLSVRDIWGLPDDENRERTDARYLGDRVVKLGQAAADNRAEYFRAATHFMQHRRFKRLRRFDRLAWELHTDGHSFVSIAKTLRGSEPKVRKAIARVRKLARLPRVISTLGHGKIGGT